MTGKRKIYDESMRLATNFSWDSDWNHALKAYRAALQEFPDDPEALIGMATAYFELEQHESAIRALQRVMKADAGHQKALKKMGEILERIGRLEEAAKTYVYSGNLYAKANNLEEATQSWEKAILADPEQMQARNNLAHAYVRLGKIDTAISELVTLAAIYQEQNDEAKAKQYLQAAQQLAPDNDFVQAAITAFEDRESIHAFQKNTLQPSTSQPAAATPETLEDEELLSFTNADIESEADRPSTPQKQVEQLALEELAGILFEDDAGFAGLALTKPQIDSLIGQAIDWQTRGDIPKTIATYEQIIKGGFTRAAVYFMLGTFYMQDARYDEAINAFNKAKTDRSYVLGINFAMGECFRHKRDANNALKSFAEVLRMIDLKNARREGTDELNRIYEKLVGNYVNAGDDKRTLTFVDSLRNFLASKDYENKIIQARQRLGGTNGASVGAWIEFLEAPNTEAILSAMSATTDYMKQNMLMTATEVCYRAIQEAPAYLPLHLRLAEIYLKQEALENSIRKYLAVAEVYNVRGDFEQSIAIYQKVLKIAPMDVSVRSKLVDLYRGRNDIEAMLEQYQILADAYYQLAQVDQSLEKYKEALQLAPKAADPKTWQVEILHHIGDIYLQRVDWASAAEVYTQLVKIAPDDDRALLALVDLNYKLGHTEKALVVLDRVMALYVKQNKQDKMLEFLQDITQLRPHELSLHERLAGFYKLLGMRLEAIEHYDILGELQLEAGLRDDATKTIQQIIDLKPDDPSGYKQLLAQIKGGI